MGMIVCIDILVPLFLLSLKVCLHILPALLVLKRKYTKNLKHLLSCISEEVMQYLQVKKNRYIEKVVLE